MKRFFLLLACIAPTAACSSSRTTAPSAGSSTTRPNIVFILADDLDRQLGTLDHIPAFSELLADQGTTFENFFVTVALCCPSRASILLGQYVHNHLVSTNNPPNGGFRRFQSLGRETNTVATWLHAAGYRTVLLGKYLNGYPEDGSPTFVPPGWDEWFSPSGGNPYSGFDYTLNESGRLVPYGKTADAYITDVMSGKAVDFIARNSAQGPFFMFVAPYAPHSPATPAPRHQGAFSGITAPRPPSFNEADVSDKPQWLRQREVLATREVAEIDELYRKRLESMLAVADMVSEIISALKTAGVLENTYIFLTSDNGFHMGEHRLESGKQAPYEEDIRVPLLVRGPGVPAGRILDHLAGNVDLAPTFAELAGSAAPSTVDGRSLVPLLGASPTPVASWRQAFLFEHGAQSAEASSLGRTLSSLLEFPDPGRVVARRGSEALAIPAFQGLRTSDTVYVEYSTGEAELYDLKSDPYELQNLGSTADPVLVSRFSSWLDGMRRCAGSNCRTQEAAWP